MSNTITITNNSDPNALDHKVFKIISVTDVDNSGQFLEPGQSLTIEISKHGMVIYEYKNTEERRGLGANPPNRE